jgi:hypothetical protein
MTFEAANHHLTIRNECRPLLVMRGTSVHARTSPIWEFDSATFVVLFFRTQTRNVVNANEVTA